MDGNRRWATAQKLPSLMGHKKGQEVFLNCVRWLRDEGISHGVFYAFSTENWQRSTDEVTYLTALFSDLLDQVTAEILHEKVRVRIVGKREDFSGEIQNKIRLLEEKSQSYTDTTIWVALSYGGRAEIIQAVNKAVALGHAIDEAAFTQLLWTAELPDPDMIIRTSGEHRLSNFLLWSSAYSELYFLEKEWPALAKTDFVDILIEYERRERRRGK